MGPVATYRCCRIERAFQYCSARGTCGSHHSPMLPLVLDIREYWTQLLNLKHRSSPVLPPGSRSRSGGGRKTVSSNSWAIATWLRARPATGCGAVLPIAKPGVEHARRCSGLDGWTQAYAPKVRLTRPARPRRPELGQSGCQTARRRRAKC